MVVSRLSVKGNIRTSPLKNIGGGGGGGSSSSSSSNNISLNKLGFN